MHMHLLDYENIFLALISMQSERSQKDELTTNTGTSFIQKESHAVITIDMILNKCKYKLPILLRQKN